MNTSTSLNTSAIDKLTGTLPVYLKYDREINPQPAYLEIDEDGYVSADSNSEIGNGVPASVWNGLTLRIHIPNHLTARGIQGLVTDLLPLLERLHTGNEIAWNGNNWTGKLTDDALEAETEILQFIDRNSTDYESSEIWDACDWLQSETPESLGITSTTTDEQLQTIADKITEETEPLTCVLGVVEYLQTIRDLIGSEDEPDED
jgi:hypothetical protein